MLSTGLAEESCDTDTGWKVFQCLHGGEVGGHCWALYLLRFCALSLFDTSDNQQVLMYD